MATAPDRDAGALLAHLTTRRIVGIFANMKARLIRRSKNVLSDGAILEMAVWQIPRPVAGCAHPYKYRLFYGRNGIRIVGYDNERGKGDHCHRGGRERSYRFTTVEVLIEDFLAEIRKRRTKK